MKSKFILIVAIAMIASAFTACQSSTAQLPEYKKYANVQEVPKLLVADAKKDIDAGIAVMVDSRSIEAYNAEHIAGSINIPVGSKASEFEKLPPNKKVIVYCSCGAEGTSMRLAYDMNQAGIANTYALQGGTASWHAAGFPMQKAN